MAVCSLRNKFRKGDVLEVVGPDLRPISFTVDEMTDLDGADLDEPRTPQMGFKLRLPVRVPAKSILRRAVDLSAK